jgi:hypothetical protein
MDMANEERNVDVNMNMSAQAEDLVDSAARPLPAFGHKSRLKAQLTPQNPPKILKTWHFLSNMHGDWIGTCPNVVFHVFMPAGY